MTKGKENRMAYRHIKNLYADQEILMFKECFAMEKIHGTSAHVSYRDGKLNFFSGGEKHDKFVALFDQDALQAQFVETGCDDVTVYGEAYGGKCQGMKDTYGPDLKFIAFEVKVGDCWLNVPNAADLAMSLGFEFVYYAKILTTLADIDRERDDLSAQAIRNGMGNDKPREGVVLRPLIELRKNNGERIVAKHKNEAFAERRNAPKVIDADKLKVLENARAVADEFVTPMRLTHVLDKMPGAGIEQTGEVIKAMIEDVLREGAGEFEDTKDVRKAVGRAAAMLFKTRIKKIVEE